MLEQSKLQTSADLAVWLALRQLEELFVRLLSRAEVAAQRREAIVGYTNARSDIDVPVAELRERLQHALPEPRALPGESWAEQIFAAILIQFDERELGADHLVSRGSATLLQTEYANTRDGGERFYVFLERALRSRATPPLVLQLFLFCMKSGFCGRYPTAEDPERLAYVQELTFRVSPPQSLRAETLPTSLAPKPLEGRGLPYWNYAIAAFALIVFWSGLQVAASVHELRLVGMTSCEDP
jgi:hypothetical protein